MDPQGGGAHAPNRHRIAVALILVLVPALLGADPRIARGEMRLRRYQWKLAIQQFDQALADDPASVPARRGLGIALARDKRCEEALPHLVQVRPAPDGWTAEAAVAEGDCRSHVGDDAAGLAAYEEAVRLDPEAGEALYKLALLRGAVGDELGAAEALDGIDALGTARAGNLRALAELWLAADRGGDEAWIALDELRNPPTEPPSPTALVEAGVVEGVLWLDAGDPLAAERALAIAGRAGRAPTRAASLRAEALRRTGRAEEALSLFDRPKLAKSDLPVKRAVLARIAVDQGRLHDARALLEGAPPDDPDILASAWYVARAEGDDGRVAALEARWDRVNPVRDRRLAHLIPWTAEAP